MPDDDAHPEYNLVDRPWIPTLRADGAVEELSLLDTFERAGDVADVVGEIPTQAFAVLRILLAVLHRATAAPAVPGGPPLTGPADIQQWQELRDDWDAACELVRSYLDHFRGRFGLFDPTRPFLQVADLRTASGEVAGLEKVIADVPNGAPYLTTRLGPGTASVSFAEAARWLVHVHAFDPSGIRSGAVGDPRVRNGKGYPLGTGWAGQLGGISLVGDTLRDTLLLNLVSPAEMGLDPDDGDLPPWERPPLGPGEEIPGGRPPHGPVDVYTWQSRRVRLVAEHGRVTGVVLSQGDPLPPQNRQGVEPMTAWRFSEPQTKKLKRPTYMPRTHDPARALWRGMEALLPHVAPRPAGSGPAPFLAPTVLRWVALLRQEGALADRRLVTTRAAGIAYGGNNATIDEVVSDGVQLPLALLADTTGHLPATALEAVDTAAAAVRALADLAGNLARASGGDPDGPRSRWREIAFAALDGPFRRWLTTLADATGAEDARHQWQVTARALVWRLGREALEAAGPSAWVGRDVQGRHLDAGLAEVWFRHALGRALPHGWASDKEESKK